MDDLLCSNAFALVQFTVNKHELMVVETKHVFPLKSARGNKETTFSYDKKWKIVVHQGPVKGGKAKNCEISILLLSNDEDSLKNTAKQFHENKVSLEDIIKRRKVIATESSDDNICSKSEKNLKDKNINCQEEDFESRRSSKRGRKPTSSDPNFEYGNSNSQEKTGCATKKKPQTKKQIANERKRNDDANVLQQIRADRSVLFTGHDEEGKDGGHGFQKKFISTTATSTQQSKDNQAKKNKENNNNFSTAHDCLTEDSQSQFISFGGDVDEPSETDLSSRSEDKCFSSESEQEKELSEIDDHFDNEETQVPASYFQQWRMTENEIEDLTRKLEKMENEVKDLKKSRDNYRTRLEQMSLQFELLEITPELVVEAKRIIDYGKQNVVGCSSFSAQKQRVMDTSRKTNNSLESCANDDADLLEDENLDEESDDEVDDDDGMSARPGAFPIKASFVEILPMDSVKKFVLNMMQGLYSKKFLRKHKMTNTAATIGESVKIPMKRYELDQIMEVVMNKFPNTPKSAIHAAIRQKFNQNREKRTRKRIRID